MTSDEIGGSGGSVLLAELLEAAEEAMEGDAGICVGGGRVPLVPPVSSDCWAFFFFAIVSAPQEGYW